MSSIIANTIYRGLIGFATEFLDNGNLDATYKVLAMHKVDMAHPAV